jgi:hypothetical protein
MVSHKKTQRMLSLRYGIILKSHNDHLDPESFEEILPFASFKIFDLSLHSVTKSKTSENIRIASNKNYLRLMRLASIFCSLSFSAINNLCVKNSQHKIYK